MNRLSKILFITGVLVFPSVQVFALDVVEQQIVSHIDAQHQRVLSLLEKSVNINSGTMNFDGVKKVAMLFQTELDKLGFEVEWVDGSAFNRAGHLLARRGNTGPKILLIGHLDTVFAVASPFQKFKQVDKNTATGPGITDMKGGVVVMIHALEALKFTGVLDRISTGIFLAGDEERRGKPLALAAKALIDLSKWADIAIGFEDGDGDPETAVISRRGTSGWVLQANGKPAHSSQIFREDIGYGAIFETSRILDQFRTQLSGIKNLTFNPGMIVGGTKISHDSDKSSGTAYGKSNVIAQFATVTGGIRALSPQQLADAQGRMQSIVNDHLNKTKATLTFADGYPPMAPTPGNRKLLSIYNQISLDLGYGSVVAVDPERAGAADISFTASHIDMAIDGIGLMGEGGHTVNETADLGTLLQQTKRAALLLYRLGK